MTTTNTKTVKPDGGGDYTTLNAWEVARRGNITAGGTDAIEIAECYKGAADLGEFSFTANWTTDATHYVKITVPSSEFHGFVQGSGSAGGAHIVNDSASAGIYLYDNEYLTIERIAVRLQASNGRGMRESYNALAPNVVLDGVYVYYISGGGRDGFIGACVYRNCVVDMSSYGGSLGFSGGYSVPIDGYWLYNCMCINCSEGFDSKAAGVPAIIANCIAINNTVDYVWGSNNDAVLVYNSTSEDDTVVAGYNKHDCQAGITAAMCFDDIATDLTMKLGTSPIRRAGKNYSAVFNEDAFELQRPGLWDIGPIQTVNVGSGEVTDAFTEMGYLVRMYYLYLNTMPNLIYLEMVKKKTGLSDEDWALEKLRQWLAQDDQRAATLATWSAGIKSLLDTYIVTRLKEILISVEATAANILLELAHVMADPSNADSVDGNTITESDSADYNNTGDGTLGSVVVSGKERLASERITIECVSAATEGSESWSVSGVKAGVLDRATTAVAYADTETLLAFLISETKLDITSGTYKWTEIGATNEFYCELSGGGDPSFTEVNRVWLASVLMTEGSAVGSLAVDEWIWGASGAGFDTIIVRLTGDVDPDTAPADLDTVGATSACALFVVGDKFYIDASSDDAGLFQSFFRDAYKQTFASETDGTETVADSLAE